VLGSLRFVGAGAGCWALVALAVAAGVAGGRTPPPGSALGSTREIFAGSELAGGFRDAPHASEKKSAALKKKTRIRSASYTSLCHNRSTLLPGDPRAGTSEAAHEAVKPEVLVRIGIVGDVHAEDEALEVVLDDLARRGVDALLCVGDIVDGAGDVNRCCALLEERKVHTVLGNHDRWLLANEVRDLPGATSPNALNARSRAFLDALPVSRRFLTPFGTLELCHGIGDNDMACVKPDHLRHELERNDALKRVLASLRCDWMVNGHTHRAMVRRVRHLTIVNAGTLHRNDERRACLLDFDSKSATFFEVFPTGLGESERITLPDVDEWSRV
jgi:putative phosphoesterase